MANSSSSATIEHVEPYAESKYPTYAQILSTKFTLPTPLEIRKVIAASTIDKTPMSGADSPSNMGLQLIESGRKMEVEFKHALATPLQ